MRIRTSLQKKFDEFFRQLTLNRKMQRRLALVVLAGVIDVAVACQELAADFQILPQQVHRQDGVAVGVFEVDVIAPQRKIHANVVVSLESCVLESCLSLGVHDGDVGAEVAEKLYRPQFVEFASTEKGAQVALLV